MLRNLRLCSTPRTFLTQIEDLETAGKVAANYNAALEDLETSEEEATDAALEDLETAEKETALQPTTSK